MTAVNLKKILNDANKNNYAVAGLVVLGWDDALAFTKAADETYNYRFKPNNGFGFQMFQQVDDKVGKAEHIINGSTIMIRTGYHPCVVAPGYEMYYFTILGGLSQRSLVQFFQPEHAYQVETIPGIKDMIAKYK